METEIIYREKSFVIVKKQSGVLSENTSGNTLGMVDLLKDTLGCGVFPIHRLDREASGVMVYATDKRCAANLSEEISLGKFKKEYLIIVHGVPEKENGIMEDLLFKDSGKNKSFVVDRERKGVKKASLEYTLLKTAQIGEESFSLVRVKLHTGRTHQIRVQFSSRNMPIVGDLRYGSNIKTEMCLFSCHIGFENPYTKEQMSFECKPEGKFWENFGE